MLTPKTEAFVRLPDDEQKRLRRAVVRSASGSSVSVFAYDGSMRLDAGDELLLFYEIEGLFHAHKGSVSRAGGERSGIVLDIEMAGSPVPAESRSSRRTNAEAAGLRADIGNECMCPLLDVGAAGFAVLGRAPRAIGEERKATIWLRDGDITGLVRLASSIRSDAQLTRYGFHILNDAEDGSVFGEALERLSEELRGEQPAHSRG